MSFVNLKLSKKKGGKDTVEAAVPYNGPNYPWGTRLSFDKEAMSKLGIDINKIKVGENVTASVKMEVVSVRQEVGEGGYNSETIELQVTDIDLGKFGKSASKEKLARFNAIKNESPTQD